MNEGVAKLSRLDLFRIADRNLRGFDYDGELGDSAADLGFDTNPDELVELTTFLEMTGKIAVDGFWCDPCGVILRVPGNKCAHREFYRDGKGRVRGRGIG